MRYDECDIMCYVTTIEPFPTPLMKTRSPGLIHEWPVDATIGWWWRKPLAWFYRLKQWWTWRHFDA